MRTLKGFKKVYQGPHPTKKLAKELAEDLKVKQEHSSDCIGWLIKKVETIIRKRKNKRGYDILARFHQVRCPQCHRN